MTGLWQRVQLVPHQKLTTLPQTFSFICGAYCIIVCTLGIGIRTINLFLKWCHKLYLTTVSDIFFHILWQGRPDALSQWGGGYDYVLPTIINPSQIAHQHWANAGPMSAEALAQQWQTNAELKIRKKYDVQLICIIWPNSIITVHLNISTFTFCSIICCCRPPIYTLSHLWNGQWTM